MYNCVNVQYHGVFNVKPIRSMNKYRLHRAIVQAIGELKNLGQEVRVTDVAQFLGCSKPVAQETLERMRMFKLVEIEERPYRKNAKIFIIHLGECGKNIFNTQITIESKVSVLEMRRVIKFG